MVKCGCVILLLTVVAACGGNGSPTAPATGLPSTVTAVTINGNLRLAPGQTSQLSAQATMSDGSRKDVTSTATWNSSNNSVAAVSQAGLVTAVDFGIAGIFVQVPGAIQNYANAQGFTVTVLPEGTYILSGGVLDPDTGGLAGVRVEIVGGPMSERATTTDTNGRYQFLGVSGVLQVIASKAGYLTTVHNVPPDSGRAFVAVNFFELAPDIPYASVGGIYQLTFKASSSCQLPEDVATRTYTAGINQSSPGVDLLVVLESGEFFNNQNHFRGHVDGNGNAVSLDLEISAIEDDPNPLDYGVFEKLAGNRYLQFDGTARGTATTSGIATTLNGRIRYLSSLGANPQACDAPDHQLLFTRTTATMSRRKF
jgi:Bacterial Ig-like domain (group 2)/Carboxypeptidase regulatory-like domain